MGFEMAPKPLVIGGFCKEGHLLEGDNVRIEGESRVRCRTCEANKSRKRRGLPLLDKPPLLRTEMKIGGKCAHGHDLTETNTYVYPEGTTYAGKVVCKDCRIESSRKSQGQEHLIGTSRQTWSAEKTHCPRGHPYDEENTYLTPDGNRKCRKCTYERNRETQYREKYGITVEQFDGMILRQSNCCAICAEEFTTTPCVDHDHTTGAVRELLCNGCNAAIGHMRENPQYLTAAANYIIKHKQ